MAQEYFRACCALGWAGSAALSVTLLATSGTAQTETARPAVPLEPISAILDAFKSHQVVTFPGGHTDENETQAMLRKLVKDPRFATTVNDIVVEFGNSRYQDVMDRYIRGEDVPDAWLRRAWLDVVGAGIAGDNDNTPMFFAAVREANAAAPPERRIRVLLGDPPIDWDTITDGRDYSKWANQRDTYPADLVRRQVLPHNRRALLVYANGHLKHLENQSNYDMTNWQAQTVVSNIEAPGGAPVFVIRGNGPLIRWQPDMASWAPMSVTRIRGTVLGAVDYEDIGGDGDQRYRVRGEGDFVPIPRDQWIVRPTEDIVDAILDTGPNSNHTSAPISAKLCADPSYIKMRLARIALIGIKEADKVKRDCNVK